VTATAARWLAKIDEARQETIARAAKLRAQRDELLERVRQHAAGGARRISTGYRAPLPTSPA